MGVYDSVYFKCPECGAEIEEQSKAGDCCLFNYSQDEVPFEIAASLNDSVTKCYECNSEFIIHVEGQLKKPPTFKMSLSKREKT